jgi:uncharacterized protein
MLCAGGEVRRGGTADLPLHNGRVPAWLAERMTRLGGAISEAVVIEFGRSELLARLSDPFWFQALGAVMGMDWHSSGITTSVMGALKRGLAARAGELGIAVCGGRGRYSRRTPDELRAWASRTGLDGEALVRASRLSAKVDNTCVQDGFSLYLHSFVVTVDGEWAVIQQGMNPASRLARRYHWHSTGVSSFVSDPQAAIVGQNQGEITNLSDGRAEPAQRGIVEFLGQRPDRQLAEMRRLLLPLHHEVTAADVDSTRLGAVLALAYDKHLSDFAEALLVPGVGPRTLQSLALVAEVIYGAPHRFSDPARFSFAHGGKDGHPFPLATRVYDESIAVLQRAVEKARIDNSERLDGLRSLSELAVAIEKSGEPTADVDAVIARERRLSPALGGRVAGDEPSAGPARRTRGDERWKQRDLFERD